MKQFILSIIILPVLFFASCTPEPIDIAIPQLPSKPVVASQYYFDTITQQSAIIISLSKTLAVTAKNKPMFDSTGVINGNTDYLVTNAFVELTTGAGTIVLTELYAGFYYAFNVELHDYEHCTLSAKAIDGTSIIQSAALAMPEIDFTSLFISKDSKGNYINYSITDDTKRKDYYLVNYLTKQKQENGSYNDPKYIARRLTEQKLDFDIYTDNDFKNGNLNVKRKLENLQYDTVAVAISNISEGYYNFLLTQKKYGLLVNQLRGEAINFPTNINGGLGYFHLSRPRLNVVSINN